MGFFPEKSKQEPKRTYTYIGIRTYLLHSNQALALHTHGFATACNPPTACNFATATANPPEDSASHIKDGTKAFGSSIRQIIALSFSSDRFYGRLGKYAHI